ncbi:bifunctional homocysteine S-methyltransferase/5,10-methylenetetrahydrofolate reductase [Halomonas elongata]|uniref:Methylenetetrahydrofolate reductase n=1 Tax=Halomonas elongata TaxID=2746 RepID=A0A1B8P388_HALEL|nr:bifunctional homocysteine S-methyltransferase/5,10-methylenetetrahydrofolate reductase [Halomonas elongata]
MLPGHVSPGRLERVLRAGRFAVTTEIDPPDSADPAEVLRRAAIFDGYVDAINATDGSGANCHMSSVGVCSLLTRVGYATILQMSCRDRNRIAMQGEILGAAAMGACNLLCLTGDGVQAGDHPHARPVFDLDSLSLLEMARRMRDESCFESGRPIDSPPGCFWARRPIPSCRPGLGEPSVWPRRWRPARVSSRPSIASIPLSYGISWPKSPTSACWKGRIVSMCWSVWGLCLRRAVRAGYATMFPESIFRIA